MNLDGEVIGVATLQLSEGQNLNFAIPSERIIRLKTGKMQNLAQWSASKLNQRQALARKLYEEGTEKFESKNYEGALESFEVAIEKWPRFEEAYLKMGDTYSELKRHDEAIAAYKEAIRINPNSAEAYHELGLEYGFLGRGQEAIDALKEAIRIKPDYEDAYVSLGHVYVAGGDKRGIEFMKQAVRIDPLNKMAHFSLGITYLIKFEDRSSALEEYKILKDIDPIMAKSLFDLIFKSSE